MSKDLDNKYFIILNKDEITFSCLNNENKIILTKKHTFTNGLNNLFGELENFLINNLIEIEKSLKDFVKKIYIIFDTDNTMSVYLSIKHKIDTDKISENKINDLLSNLKYQFTKYNNDLKVIHMKIIKLLIDGKEKDLSSFREAFDNLIVEVNFKCLKNQTIHFVKKLCSNYQISVEKILLANHLRQSFLNNTDNIVFLANKLLSGQVNNEVMWIRKNLIKQGFFTKFFNFFN